MATSKSRGHAPPTTDLLLDRSTERDLILEALADVSRGHGRALLFEGPLGIGKTRILEELHTRAHENGAELFRVRGGELERRFPFGIIRQLFEARLATASPELRATLLAGAARGAAAVLEGEPSQADAGTGRDGDSQATLRALYWLCANLSRGGPMVLLIDDAHWADEPSLRFINYLLTRLEGLPVLVGLAAEPGGPGQAEDLLAPIAAAWSTQVVDLRPLSERSVANLVRTALGVAPHERFVAACHRATGGNPYYLRELLTEVRARSWRPTDAAAARIAELTSSGIVRSVRDRLRRLPVNARRVASAMAVLGARAEPGHVLVLTGLSGVEFEQAVGALEDDGLVHCDPPPHFVHPVLRNAVYEGLRSAERSAGHARAAELLAADGAPCDQVGLHLLATKPGTVAEARDVLRRAAAEARARGTPAAAARYLRRALAEPLDRVERREVLVDLGTAELLASEPAAADHLERALAIIADPSRRATVGLCHGRALAMRGRIAEAIAALDGLLAEPGDIDEELRLRLEAELILLAGIHAKARSTRAGRMPALRRGIRDDQADGPGTRILLGSLATAELFAGKRADRVVALATRALEGDHLLVEEGSGSPPLVLAALALGLGGRLDEADQALGAALDHARATGSVLGFTAVSCFRALVAHHRGRLTDAVADARAALDTAGEVGDSWLLGVPMANAFLVDTLIERRELGEAAEVFETGILERYPPDQSMASNLLLAGRGRLRIASGRLEEGLEDLFEHGRREAGFGPGIPALSPWRTDAALCLLRLDRVAEADRLAGQELELARAFGAPRPLARALRVRGLVAGGAEAVESAAKGVQLVARSPARLEWIHCLVDLGAARRRGGERIKAREHLHEALELATEGGARTLAERAEEELKAAGVRRGRGPARRGVRAALTPSELRVARMAATGLRNREIAQALFITLKTVEWHLSQTYRKLDVSSRAGLPEALAASRPEWPRASTRSGV